MSFIVFIQQYDKRKQVDNGALAEKRSSEEFPDNTKVVAFIKYCYLIPLLNTVI